MSDGIDYSNLSLQDTLDFAFLVEEEAQERYQDFAEQLEAHRTDEAAKFFTFMAGIEAKHANRLDERRKALFGDAPRNIDRSMLYDVEAPDFDRARAFMSVKAALQVALQSEIKAYDFYDQVLPKVDDGDVKALFTELRDEEMKHQEMVKAELEKTPDGPDVDPDDYVDGPAAQ